MMATVAVSSQIYAQGIFLRHLPYGRAQIVSRGKLYSGTLIGSYRCAD